MSFLAASIAPTQLYNASMSNLSYIAPHLTIRAGEVLHRLEQDYDRPAWNVLRPPLDELVMTILSQHTSDVNCERAFNSLKQAFPTWSAVAAASERDIERAIRPGGLAATKAPRIKAAVARVLETGALDDLDELSLPDAKSRLQSLPGVGPKTAACVLLFACRRPALPVDTHVHRVSRRLGLIDDSTNAEKAHELLESLLPEEDVYSFHVNLITHGRRICRARAPHCPECSLRNLCDYATSIVNTEDETTGIKDD